jgi:hypothetical protein
MKIWDPKKFIKLYLTIIKIYIIRKDMLYYNNMNHIKNKLK